MTPIEKRIASCKAKCLEIIKAHPGTIDRVGSKWPVKLREQLPVLEAEGKIEYRNGWYIK